VSEVDAQGLKSIYLKIQGGGPPAEFRYVNRCNSAADCSMSLKFSTEFDHVTPDVLQTFKVKWQKSRSKHENVVW